MLCPLALLAAWAVSLPVASPTSLTDGWLSPATSPLADPGMLVTLGGEAQRLFRVPSPARCPDGSQRGTGICPRSHDEVRGQQRISSFDGL